MSQNLPDAPAPRTRPARVTSAERAQRVDFLLSYLVSGYTRSDLCQIALTKWGVSASQCDRYAAAARDLLKAQAEKTRELNFAEHLAHRRDLRKRARLAGNMQVELLTAQDEAKLLSLYPAAKVRVTDWRDEAIAALRSGEITPDQLRADLAALGMEQDAESIIVAAGAAADGERTVARAPRGGSAPTGSDAA